MQSVLEHELAPHAARSTGLALLDDATLCVTTTAHAFRIPLEFVWHPGAAWPASFRRAAAITLLAARFGARHAAPAAGAAVQLWHLPRDSVLQILRQAAAEPTDWAALEDPEARCPEACEVLAAGIALPAVDACFGHVARCRERHLLLPGCSRCTLSAQGA